MHINYFDLGLCRGEEIRMMKKIIPEFSTDFSIYGFEACKRYVENLSYLVDKNTAIYHLAISNSTDEFVKLYYSPNMVGHSIYSSKNNVTDIFENVPCIRFSKWLDIYEVVLDGSVNIVKINIEGAEWDFFNDVVEHGLHKKIDIFCGSSILENDVEKIKDFVRDGIDKKYFQLLSDNNIKIERFTEWKPQLNSDMRKLIQDAIATKKSIK